MQMPPTQERELSLVGSTTSFAGPVSTTTYSAKALSNIYAQGSFPTWLEQLFTDPSKSDDHVDMGDVPGFPDGCAVPCWDAWQELRNGINLQDAYFKHLQDSADLLDATLRLAAVQYVKTTANILDAVLGILTGFKLVKVPEPTKWWKVARLVNTVTSTFTGIKDTVQDLVRSGATSGWDSLPQTVIATENAILDILDELGRSNEARKALGEFLSTVSSIMYIFTDLKKDLEDAKKVTRDVRADVAALENTWAGYLGNVKRANTSLQKYKQCLAACASGQDPGQDPGQDSDEGQDGDLPHDDQQEVPRPESRDPNDILGPQGFGVEHWVAETTPLNYTVRFENDPLLADAPAQVVQITLDLDEDLDWRTLQLGAIAFGQHVIEVPDARPHYAGEVVLDNGLLARVDASIDIQAGQVTWTLTTIDPQTGEVPEDPFLGLLPPNDPETQSGEGHVTFTIRPRPDATTGTEITASATIIFDVNEPIDTNEVFNTIDSVPPTSEVADLLSVTDTTEFMVNWSGADDPGGSGLANYTIYVSADGGTAAAWLERTTLTEAVYIGERGRSYAFYSIATDNVGHREAAPATPDTVILVATPAVIVTPEAGLVTAEPSGQAEFFVRLGGRPTHDVTVAVASSDTSEGTVSISELTFTPDTWNTPQTVTVTGADDTIGDGDVGYTIVLGPVTSDDPVYAALDPADVSITNIDNDTSTVRIVDITVSAPLAQQIDVVFSDPMAIPPLITDGSIISAVLIVNLSTGPVALNSSQFTYDEPTQTLTWLGVTPVPGGNYELRFDGSTLADLVGNALVGGSGGLQFGVPEYSAEQLVQASGADLAVASYSVPLLTDWNSDGLMDLVVGEKTVASQGKVRVYLNSGTTTVPVFTTFDYARLDGGAHLTVPATGCLGAFPRVFDFDGDGKRDLLIGRADGKVQFFPNTNTDADPRFGSPVFLRVGEPGSKIDIDVGDRATLEVVDWNRDGRYDLVLGALDGRVRVYLNEAPFGAADFRTELVVQDGWGDLIVPSGRSSVAVADLNGDGRKDLLVGNTEGELLLYANIESDVAPAFDGWEPLQAGGAVVDLPGTPRSRPFVGDFDADGNLDLLVGAENGLVRLYLGQANLPQEGGHYVTEGPVAGMYVHTFDVSSNPPIAAILARHVFYNNSAWDGHAEFENGDPAANEFDDAAIATDKQALLPGQTATFANYTSYHRGINGVMVDILGLADPEAVADGDFSEFAFKVGNSNDPTLWQPATDPLDVDVRDLGGGVHRVTITWADNAIPNKNWLQVTVKEHAVTGLGADDVFYFGNSSGENTGNFRVDYGDAFDVIWPLLFTPDPIGVDHPGDVNRDGRIDYGDIFDAVWPNLFGPSPLVQLTAPTTPAAPLESTDSIFDENLPWAIELLWFDELYGTSSDSEEEEETLEATAVDGVFMMYSEE